MLWYYKDIKLMSQKEDTKLYKRISIRIVPDLSENLKVIAQKRGLSVNSLISEMAWDFVEDWKIKYENVRST